ncbi:MAG: 3-hydroxyacyl-CoA dehydrogenase family protein [Mycobacteriales bacterium]
MQQVAVIGAGTMGRGIALAFAMARCSVQLVDVSVDFLRTAESRLSADLRSIEAASAVLDRVSYTTSVKQAVANADLVVESVPEDLALKREVWASLGAAAGAETVLATNTSSFDVALLAALVPHPERVLGLHWFNPAHLVPCVEIVRAPSTAEKVLLDIERLLIDMGKKPAVVRSTPGFVANRIQMAMAAEAFRCLEEGVASAEAIDDIVRHSLGFRLVDLGPLAIADLAGMDVYDAIYGYLTQTLGDRFTTPATVKELVQQGHLGVKAGRGVYGYSPDEADAMVRRRDRGFARRARAAAGAEARA